MNAWKQWRVPIPEVIQEPSGQGPVDPQIHRQKSWTDKCLEALETPTPPLGEVPASPSPLEESPLTGPLVAKMPQLSVVPVRQQGSATGPSVRQASTLQLAGGLTNHQVSVVVRHWIHIGSFSGYFSHYTDSFREMMDVRFSRPSL